MRELTEQDVLYFGYGSNLWLDQMAKRCPNSTFKGIAKLPRHLWIINERGYANVVPVGPMPTVVRENDHSTEAWGLVYLLTPSDQKKLDINEGVPDSYQKAMLPCKYWPADHVNMPTAIVDMLVYISRDYIVPSRPKHEYIYRMNMGIADAVSKGVPQAYIDQVIRPFIPNETDPAVATEANQQAAQFEDK